MVIEMYLQPGWRSDTHGRPVTSAGQFRATSVCHE